MDLFVTHNTDICYISVIILSIDTFTKDTSDKTTNEKQRPELKPETKARTPGAGSRASVDQKKPFEDGRLILSFAS